MCEPATIGYGLAALVGGLAIGKALTPQQPGYQAAPEDATPPAPTPIKAAPVAKTAQPVQQAKAPDVQALRAANTAGGAASRGTNATATMLTGAGGVDLSSLNIGKNTLLGGGG